MNESLLVFDSLLFRNYVYNGLGWDTKVNPLLTHNASLTLLRVALASHTYSCVNHTSNTGIIPNLT